MEDKKKLTAFRLDEDIRSMADQSILIRATLRKNRRPETFSGYLRNIIIEDFSRYKKMLLNQNKNGEQSW